MSLGSAQTVTHALKSTRNWRVMLGERKMSERLPVIRFARPDTVVTKDGDAMRVYKLEGLHFETLEEGNLEGARNLLASFYRQNGDARTMFYLHTVRRRVRDDEIPGRKKTGGFEGYLDYVRRLELDRAGLHHVNHYLTIVRRPYFAKIRKLGGRRREEAERAQRREAREEVFRDLDTIALAVETLLDRFGPVSLRADQSDRPEILSFFSMLANGVYAPIRPSKMGLNELIPSHRAVFRKESIDLWGAAPEDTRHAAMLGLKGYGDETWPGVLNAMLSAPCEFIATQSLQPEDTTETLAGIKWARRLMQVSADEAEEVASELGGAIEDASSGREIFGWHHFTIALLAPTPRALAQSVSSMTAALTAANLRPVREDIALEALWWAQFPGNHGYRGRRARISATNFADLAPAHSYPQGARSDLPWGEPVALLESTSGTPYFFNFHAPGQTNGSTLIVGPSGTGKTALIGFLLARARLMDEPPRIFYFDKDRGADATIRALGGAYSQVAPGDKIGFNPFAHATDEQGKAWLREWTQKRLDHKPTPAQREAIAQAVEINATSDVSLRRFRHFAELFATLDDGGELRDELADWHGAGARSWMFDAEKDGLDLSPKICGFDMTQLLKDDTGAEAFVDYLFFRLDRALRSGERTIIVLDEAWRLIKSPVFAAKIEDWLKTIRKLNGLVVFVTQDPEDASRSAIAPVVVNQTVTKIFFPNETPDADVYCDVFGVTPRELELLRQTPLTERSFLLRQGNKAVMARLDLGGSPEVLKVLSGTAKTVADLDIKLARHGDDWLPHYMEVTL